MSYVCAAPYGLVWQLLKMLLRLQENFRAKEENESFWFLQKDFLWFLLFSPQLLLLLEYNHLIIGTLEFFLYHNT